jgi:hypothetical protein
MINLVRLPFLLGGLILGMGINSCPAEPGRAVALAKAESGRADQTNLFGVSFGQVDGGPEPGEHRHFTL